MHNAEKRKELEVEKRKALAVEENAKYSKRLEQIQDFFDRQC